MADYVVIARFDEETDKRMNALRNLLTQAGYSVPEWPPHITIAAYENLNEELLCSWTREFSSKHEKLSVALLALSVLPPGGAHTETAVLCLDPAHAKTFVDFYYAFHEKYEEYCTGIGRFNSISHNHPIIHATIATVKVDQLQKAMELVFSSGVRGIASITALEVYTYPMRLIKRFELR